MSTNRCLRLSALPPTVAELWRRQTDAELTGPTERLLRPSPARRTVDRLDPVRRLVERALHLLGFGEVLALPAAHAALAGVLLVAVVLLTLRLSARVYVYAEAARDCASQGPDHAAVLLDGGTAYACARLPAQVAPERVRSLWRRQ